MVAYLGVNLGVLAVSTVLVSASVGAGLGLGLFGVLSIIRLRSDELTQHEIAYYFSALALGLLGGLGGSVELVAPLMALVVGALFVADHPAVLRGQRREVIVVDRAIADEAALVAHLERHLGGTVHRVQVLRLDLVNDTTTVDVRFRAASTRRVEQHEAVR